MVESVALAKKKINFAKFPKPHQKRVFKTGKIYPYSILDDKTLVLLQRISKYVCRKINVEEETSVSGE